MTRDHPIDAESLMALSDVIDWRPSAGTLADSLVACGAIRDASWRSTFAATPRHVFVPSYWETDDYGSPSNLVDGTDTGQRSAWLAEVYSDRSLVTRWATVTVNDAAIRVVSMAVPSPGTAAVMLDRLELHRGHRVLEVGTGTGYVTALLGARVGAEHVTSIDVDPEQLGLAADHLYGIEHRPSLAIADPLEGWPASAPYDRILVTGAVSTVPSTWIEQLAPDGRIVIPLDFGHALAVLVRASSSELTGRVDGRAVDALPLRGYDQPSSPIPSMGVGSLTTASCGEVKTGTTYLAPTILADQDIQLWLSLHLPGVRILDARHSPNEDPIATLIYTHDGRATVGHHATGDRFWPIVQDRRRIWDRVEAAVRNHERAGRPARNRLGITIRVDPPEQSAWLDSPHSRYRWPFPSTSG